MTEERDIDDGHSWMLAWRRKAVGLDPGGLLYNKTMMVFTPLIQPGSRDHYDEEE